jgi:hypothetical protein
MTHVGIDLHKTQFTVCVCGNGAERLGVESTGNTRHFKSRMEAAGIGVTVINTLNCPAHAELAELRGSL